VTVAAPLERPVQSWFETTGQTAASQRVEIRAKVSGYLKKIGFEDGELVEKDQLLFVIDKGPYEAAVAAADAQLARAKAQLTLAEQELTRTQGLAQRQAATQSTLDEQQAQKASAAADVAAAQAAIQEARLNLGYTEIRAPFAGRISENMLDVGNLVQPGETLLARIEAVSPIYAYFTLSESDLLNFMRMQREGELKISDADPIEIELALGESGDFAYKGVLDYREFGIDPSTGTTRRRAVFENEDGALIPGLFVRVRAKVGDPKPRLLVQERALGADQRGDYVLVVNDKNVVEHRAVRLGRKEGNLRAIENGLEPGVRVVINGLQRARPGSEVEPVEEQMEAVAAATDSGARQPKAASAEEPPAQLAERTPAEEPAAPAKNTAD
jgi:RND family efflux transporter MFP subunit